MKTKILSIILMFLVMSGLSQSTFAATANNADYTILSNIKMVNKIEVHGNVELYISDSSVDQVKVFNKYYSENSFVQEGNGVLKISSNGNEKLIVWVSADNLLSVSAFDNAEVTSLGTLSKIEFNIDLHNSASASLNLDAYSSNVNLTDNAKVKLSGKSIDFSINHNNGSVVTNNEFSADHYYDMKTGANGEIKSSVLTVLE